MSSKIPMFAFSYSGRTVAVIQAISKKQARARAHLISHIVKIPKHCKVRAIRHGTICRAAVFFDGHFRAIEEAFAEAYSDKPPITSYAT